MSTFSAMILFDKVGRIEETCGGGVGIAVGEMF
jgi:hypothetical protein